MPRTILVDCRKVRHAKPDCLRLHVCLRCGSQTFSLEQQERCMVRKVRGRFARFARPCRGELVRIMAVDP